MQNYRGKDQYLDNDNQKEEEKEKINLKRLQLTKSKTKPSFTRWGKEKDKLAFNLLELMCAENNLHISVFIQTKLSWVINEKTHEFISILHQNIIECIAIELNWNRKSAFLFKRFQNIYSHGNMFSSRELKLLKSIVLRTKGYPNYEKDIKFHFPGKSEEAIDQEVNRIMKSKRFLKFTK